MPKRRNNSGEGVSLFPFMSILACLIGILTLMISVSMKVKQMENDGQNEQEKALALENRALKKQAAEIQEKVKTANTRLENENATVSQLAKLKELKIVLKQKLEEIELAKDPEKSDAALQKIVENLKKEIAALTRERPSLVKKLEELKAELAKRKNPPKPVESVVIRPSGSGVRAASRLFFVEANSTGIVILNDDGEKVTVSTDVIATNPAYARFLAEVKATRDSMVLFLIRREGNLAYAWAAGVAESKFELKTGKLPVPNDGNIDLSMFQKK